MPKERKRPDGTILNFLSDHRLRFGPKSNGYDPIDGSQHYPNHRPSGTKNPVSKAEGRIITVGAVVIFEPCEPMPTGQQTLEISEVKDLVGNAMSDGHQISFQVAIVPPVEEELTEEETALTVVLSRGGIFGEVEKFVTKKGNSIGSYKAPFKARVNPDQGVEIM